MNYRRFISKKIVILLTSIFFSITQANADQAYTFTFLEGADIGYGYLFTDNNGYAYDGSLTISSGVDIGDYNLFSIGPTISYTPDGAFIVDNATYYDQASQLDYWGLFFTGNDINGRQLSMNIWSNAPSELYSFWSYDESLHYFNVADSNVFFSMQKVEVAFSNIGISSSVPEPSVMTLMTLGLFSLGYFRSRKSGI